MRQITRTIKAAFDNQTSRKVSNTTTDGQQVLLHGNKIIQRQNGEVFFSLVGWATPTTKERLKIIDGLMVFTRKGVTYGQVQGQEAVELDPRGWYSARTMEKVSWA